MEFLEQGLWELQPLVSQISMQMGRLPKFGQNTLVIKMRELVITRNNWSRFCEIIIARQFWMLLVVLGKFLAVVTGQGTKIRRVYPQVGTELFLGPKGTTLCVGVKCDLSARWY